MCTVHTGCTGCNQINWKCLKAGWLNAQSIVNKTMAISEVSVEKHLDVFAVTESWHRSAEYICLSCCASTSLIVDAVHEFDHGQGGIVLFHQNS
jgi:hypothetical protein